MSGEQAITVLVVDDEEPARRRLVRMLGRIAGVRVLGEAADGVDARAALRRQRPDVVLLDIHMPELDGLTLLAEEPDMPPVVFTTAYDQHAVRAFELAAVDYLLKPIQQARLEQALGRARALAAAELVSLHGRLFPAAPPRLMARSGGTTRLFDPEAITRIWAADKYALFVADGREFVLDDSLVSLERQLSAHNFLRVHRAELVNLAAVVALHERGGRVHVELSDGQRAAVSRRLLAELKRRLGVTG